MLHWLTTTRLAIVLAVMVALVMTDQVFFGQYDYYTSVTSLGRFILATLLSISAVMLFERRPQ